ncbi:MAG: HD domain-containing protein [Patescibacteria group bacterium]
MQNTYSLCYSDVAPDVWAALAKIERTGWVMRGISDPETVQEHTLALIRLAEEIHTIGEYKANGLFQILEVHDWPEAIVGDEVIIEYDEEKRRRLKVLKNRKEVEAMKEITRPLGEVGKEINALWLRYENSSDETAQFAKELDKYQAVEQALTYEIEQNKNGIYYEFLDYLQNSITSEVLKEKLYLLEQKAHDHGIERKCVEK